MTDQIYALPDRPSEELQNKQVANEIDIDRGYQTDKVYVQYDSNGKVSAIRIWSMQMKLNEYNLEEPEEVGDILYTYTLDESGKPIRYSEIQLYNKDDPNKVESYTTEISYSGNSIIQQKYSGSTLISKTTQEFNSDPSELAKDVVAINFLNSLIKQGYTGYNVQEQQDIQKIQLVKETTLESDGQTTETAYSYTDTDKNTTEITIDIKNAVENTQKIKVEKKNDKIETVCDWEDANIQDEYSMIEFTYKGDKIEKGQVYLIDKSETEEQETKEQETEPYITYEYKYETLGDLYVTNVIDTLEQVKNTEQSAQSTQEEN